MLAPPPAYRVRVPVAADLEAVAGLLETDDLADTGAVAFDAEFLRVQWAVPGFDLANDAWLVERPDGSAAAYAQARREDEDLVASWGVVHPDDRGRGLGAYLLERVEAHAADVLPSGGRLLCAVTDTDAAAAELLVARGFELRRSYRMMQVDLDRPVDPGRAPNGIAIGGIDLEHDLRIVHGVLVEAFGDDDAAPEPFDEWHARITSSPGFAPETWLLASDGERPVGALDGGIWGNRGRVSELGVLPDARRRGIAAALLRRAFAAFAARGLLRATLEVDTRNPTDAMRLYERVGMYVVRGWDTYDKPVADRSAKPGDRTS